MSRRINPANHSKDGSAGRFVRGLPADVAGPSDDPIDYDSQAGCPRDVAGGSYQSPVTGIANPGSAPARLPFKLSK